MLRRTLFVSVFRRQLPQSQAHACVLSSRRRLLESALIILTRSCRKSGRTSRLTFKARSPSSSWSKIGGKQSRRFKSAVSDNNKWEERWHPLREEWVIIAAHRQD